MIQSWGSRCHHGESIWNLVIWILTLLLLGFQCNSMSSIALVLKSDLRPSTIFTSLADICFFNSPALELQQSDTSPGVSRLRRVAICCNRANLPLSSTPPTSAKKPIITLVAETAGEGGGGEILLVQPDYMSSGGFYLKSRSNWKPPSCVNSRFSRLLCNNQQRISIKNYSHASAALYADNKTSSKATHQTQQWGRLQVFQTGKQKRREVNTSSRSAM